MLIAFKDEMTSNGAQGYRQQETTWRGFHVVKHVRKRFRYGVHTDYSIG